MSGKYKLPSLTVDALILFKNQIVLIRRKHDPFKGLLAFPGGFVNYGENPEVSVVRELMEETNLKGKLKSLVGVYGEPERDPRSHVISIAYELEVDSLEGLKAQDDASEVILVDVLRLISQEEKLAFDHFKILRDFLTKINYQNLK